MYNSFVIGRWWFPRSFDCLQAKIPFITTFPVAVCVGYMEHACACCTLSWHSSHSILPGVAVIGWVSCSLSTWDGSPSCHYGTTNWAINHKLFYREWLWLVGYLVLWVHEMGLPVVTMAPPIEPLTISYFTGSGCDWLGILFFEYMRWVSRSSLWHHQLSHQP